MVERVGFFYLPPADQTVILMSKVVVSVYKAGKQGQTRQVDLFCLRRQGDRSLWANFSNTLPVDQDCRVFQHWPASTVN